MRLSTLVRFLLVALSVFPARCNRVQVSRVEALEAEVESLRQSHAILEQRLSAMQQDHILTIQELQERLLALEGLNQHNATLQETIGNPEKNDRSSREEETLDDLKRYTLTMFIRLSIAILVLAGMYIVPSSPESSRYISDSKKYKITLDRIVFA